MSSRKFAAIFVLIFLVGALPLLLVQPSGLASAGLSMGFSRPVESALHVVGLVLIGLTASVLGRESNFLVPLNTVLAILVAALLKMDAYTFPERDMVVLGAMLLFAMASSVVFTRAFMVTVLLAASFGFHAGSQFLDYIPSIANPLYYLLGMLISSVLLLAVGVSLGLGIRGMILRTCERMKNVRAIASFLSLF